MSSLQRDSGKSNASSMPKHVILGLGIQCMQGARCDRHQYLYATGAATCEENEPQSKKCGFTLCQQVCLLLHTGDKADV